LRAIAVSGQSTDALLCTSCSLDLQNIPYVQEAGKRHAYSTTRTQL